MLTVIPYILPLQLWGIPVATMGNLLCNFVQFHYATNTNKEMESLEQSTDGRLWDTLIMLHISIKEGDGSNHLLFEVMYSMGDEDPTVKELKAVISGGDNGEPVITIMYKYED